jgi:hypothetical protein
MKLLTYFIETVNFQINQENKLFKDGKASFYEKLNANSDLPKDVFEKQKEGEVNRPTGRGMGEIDRDESEWFTHPDLEELYRTVERQTIPSSYDATTKGKIICF